MAAADPTVSSHLSYLTMPLYLVLRSTLVKDKDGKSLDLTITDCYYSTVGNVNPTFAMIYCPS